MITALIDGDWILYAAGFAGQKAELVCPTAFGDKTFKNITEIRKAWESWGKEGETPPVYRRDVLDPETHFYHSAKMMIQRNCEKIEEKFREEVEPVVLIDGDGNFRSRIATIRPYKGTRSVHAKPIFYNNIRQYLLDAWAAEVIHEQETDDEMAIRQTAFNNQGQKCIIVGVDKDMLQVPGWHLNPNKGFKTISRQEGLERLYVQCISGDTVDNIGGAYKFGPVAAKRMIMGKNLSEVVMWERVLSAYAQSIKMHGNELYGGLNAAEAALENMRLVFLRRIPGEQWNPPEV